VNEVFVAGQEGDLVWATHMPARSRERPGAPGHRGTSCPPLRGGSSEQAIIRPEYPLGWSTTTDQPISSLLSLLTLSCAGYVASSLFWILMCGSCVRCLSMAGTVVVFPWPSFSLPDGFNYSPSRRFFDGTPAAIVPF